MCKKRFKLIQLLFFFSLAAQGATSAGSPITLNVNGDTVINTLSDHFFGHNYWMWTPTWGNSTAGTETIISDLGVKLLRFGGTNVDVGFPDSITDEVLEDFSNYCTSIGAAPYLQLQLARHSNTDERVSNALKMLQRFKTMQPVEYVAIGNEPDIYPENIATSKDYDATYLSDYSVSDYCNDFNAVAAELKKNDSSLKIIGLELSWKREEWIPDFVANCKDNIDMISLHYYPFDAASCYYRNARNQVTAIASFYKNMRELIDQNAGGKEIPLIIGEANISWDGDPQKSIEDASPGTFNAALWFADFVGVSSAQENLFSIMPWSIREGWTLGFLNSSKKPRPVYYIYQMFSQHSKRYMIHNERVNASVRVYGYKDDQNNISLFAVNWDTVSSYNIGVNFSKILNDSLFSFEVPPQSITCVAISSDFKDKEVMTYSKDMTQPAPVLQSAAERLQKIHGVLFSFDKHKLVAKITSPKKLNNAVISVFDLQGKQLLKFNTGRINSGNTFVQIPQLSLPSGQYLMRLSTEEAILTELVLLN